MVSAAKSRGRGRRPRFGDAVVPKSITFKPQTLERLTRLATVESNGNLSECVNELLEEALASREAEAAIDSLANLIGVEVGEEDVQRASAWLLRTARRIAEKRAAPAQA